MRFFHSLLFTGRLLLLYLILTSFLLLDPSKFEPLTVNVGPIEGLLSNNTNKVTRGNDFRSLKHSSHCDLRKFSFTNRIVNIWNSLPNIQLYSP